MKTPLSACATLAVLLFAAGTTLKADNPPANDWKQALPGWRYSFPADHRIHPDFKTEWWYFTGHLQSADGRAYGYELTFFRQGMLPPGARPPVSADGKELSRFVQNDFKFAHFAISDLKGEQFHYTEKITRGAYGEAGFGVGGDPRLAWLQDWQLDEEADGSWHLRAGVAGPEFMKIDLVVKSTKPPTIEGTDGVSQKADGLGNASHYYSLTRMTTKGKLAVGEGAAAVEVRGDSWFDHEWASNQLAPEQVGWDWFCFQFDDQTELMLYAMRRRDGSIDPASAGTFIDANGGTEHLERKDFQLKPLRSWRSAKTSASYPLSWQVSIPSKQISFRVDAQIDHQELALPLISYWEGATAINGERAGRKLVGAGYMELTGYAAELQGLKSSGKGGAGVGNIPR